MLCWILESNLNSALEFSLSFEFSEGSSTGGSFFAPGRGGSANFPGLGGL